MKDFIKYYLYKMIAGVFSLLFSKRPLENKVVFMSFYGTKYDCNPRAISEKLHNLYPEIEQIWILRKRNNEIPIYIKQVKYMSINMFKELFTAKVWVDNSTKSLWTNKRKGQFFIETWHGGLGFKKFGSDAISDYSSFDNKRDMHSCNMTNVILSDSKSMTEIYRSAWPYYKGKIYECGFPRTDLLYNNELIEKEKIKVKQDLGISINSEILLYAPTFREDDDPKHFKLNYKEMAKKLSSYFNKKIVIVVKLHPWSVNLANQICEYDEDVINASQYSNMQGLIAAADYFVTDFSSCIFDYIILRKPAFLYADDFDEYINSERGLYLDIKDLPFSISRSEDELINNIIKHDNEEYKKNVELFLSKLGYADVPNSSEKVCYLINKVLTRG